jgi:DNA polymerase III delta prime subunit
LELNASDERGISVVRDKIKQFASLSVGNGTSNKSASSFFQKDKDTINEDNESNRRSEDSYPNPPFKIIILDEAGEYGLRSHTKLMCDDAICLSNLFFAAASIRCCYTRCPSSVEANHCKSKQR